MTTIPVKHQITIDDFERGWTRQGRRDHSLRQLMNSMAPLTVVVISHDGQPCREGRPTDTSGPCRLSSKVTRYRPKDGRRFHTRHLEGGDFAIACYPQLALDTRKAEP